MWKSYHGFSDWGFFLSFFLEQKITLSFHSVSFSLNRTETIFDTFTLEIFHLLSCKDSDYIHRITSCFLMHNFTHCGMENIHINHAVWYLDLYHPREACVFPITLCQDSYYTQQGDMHLVLLWSS